MAKNDFVQLRKDVRKKFDEIREVVNIREKLLLRQEDLLIHSSSSNSSPHTLFNERAEFITDNEGELVKLIRNYGKFNYDSINLAFSSIFKNEYDSDPQVDHETMYKCLSDECAIEDQINANDEQVIVDFTTNRRMLRDSIINITVKETKELVEGGRQKSEPSVVSTLDLSSSVTPTETSSTKDAKTTKSSQTEVPAKKKRSFRPKITINNCNGIINLRNIANLTINCAKDSSIRKEKSPRKDMDDMEENTVTSTTKEEDLEGNCEFYNRLLNEIKNSLLLKKTPTYSLPHSKEEEDIPVGITNEEEEEVSVTPDSTNDDSEVEKTSVHPKYVLKNFENLKIILESDGVELHPVQIEQWLAEIVSETEVEPNIGELFEHSEITS